MSLPLEDNYEDILGKALRGWGLEVSELSQRAGVSADALASQLRGDFDPAVARAIAPHLKLDIESLVAAGQKHWYPQVPAVPGMEQVNTQWSDMTVNAYAAWDRDGDAAIFDTGADAGPLLEVIRSHSLRVHAIFITHTHGDHVAGLEALRAACPDAALYGSRREPTEGAELLDGGEHIDVGSLRIEPRLTWGHSKGALSYVIRGLDQLVVVVGDALFAGSMGGGMVSFRDAIDTNLKQLFTLSDETAVCPGHGPMTTIGQERRNNPFFADYFE